MLLPDWCLRIFFETAELQELIIMIAGRRLIPCQNQDDVGVLRLTKWSGQVTLPRKVFGTWSY